MDHIFLKGFRITGKHGAFEEERRVEQEFDVSVSAALDARKAAASDELRHAADYLDFQRAIERVMKGESCYLVERLAERIAGEILADTKIAEVRVTIRKPAALKNGIPGVSIVRTRA